MEQPRPAGKLQFSEFQFSKFKMTVNQENTLENWIGNQGIDMFPFIDEY